MDIFIDQPLPPVGHPSRHLHRTAFGAVQVSILEECPKSAIQNLHNYGKNLLRICPYRMLTCTARRRECRKGGMGWGRLQLFRTSSV
jgi:hypothetical protein